MPDNNAPLVSIIVPVYKVEKYIEQCARSIFEQTYRNLEIIFVDDCSPDNSFAILQSTLEDYPYRKSQTKIIRHRQNKGLSMTRRTGISNATGTYVINCDGDDYIELNMTTALMEIALRGNYEIIATPIFIDSPSGKSHILKIGDTNNFFNLNSIPINVTHFSLCNKIFKKNLLDQLTDTPNVNSWEDLADSARAIALAKSTLAIDTPFYHYRMSDNSLTSMNHKKRLTGQLAVAKFVEQWFIANHLDGKYAVFLKNMKFSSKIKFLRGNQRDFAAWKSTFPETNSGILGYTHIPLFYRLLFFMANALPSRLCQWCSDMITKK